VGLEKTSGGTSRLYTRRNFKKKIIEKEVKRGYEDIKRVQRIRAKRGNSASKN
jgi:hypothetical protein